MTTWHGYPQHPDAHPERPWWRLRSVPREGWSNRALHMRAGDLDPVTGEPLEYDRSYGLMQYDRVHEQTTDTVEGYSFHIDLAAYDAAHPIPAPPPRCGQVWLWVEDTDFIEKGYQGMVTEVETDTYGFAVPVGCLNFSQKAWPPTGAVLVAGPGSPWAPMGVG